MSWIARVLAGETDSRCLRAYIIYQLLYKYIRFMHPPQSRHLCHPHIEYRVHCHFVLLPAP